MLWILECSILNKPSSSKPKSLEVPDNFYSSCFNGIFFVSNCRSKLFLRTNSLPVAFWLPFPPGLDNVVALMDTSWKAKSSNSTWKRSSPRRPSRNCSWGQIRFWSRFGFCFLQAWTMCSLWRIHLGRQRARILPEKDQFQEGQQIRRLFVWITLSFK